METVLVPFFNLINVDKKMVNINHDLDDIIISSKIGDFPKVRYGLPFGPFYFLVLFLAYPRLWSKSLFLIHIINLMSVFLWPSFIYLLITGIYSISFFINSYDFAYKALLLSFLILELHHYQKSENG